MKTAIAFLLALLAALAGIIATDRATLRASGFRHGQGRDQ